MKLDRRARRRLRPLVWPATLLAVGWLLGQAAFLLASAQGLTFRLYGVVQGVGDLVVLIGLVWLVVALIRIVLSLRRAS